MSGLCKKWIRSKSLRKKELEKLNFEIKFGNAFEKVVEKTLNVGSYETPSCKNFF